MKSTTTRALRAHLSRALDRAANGEDVVVTKRGRAFVRIVRADAGIAATKYPLCGSVLYLADDFDAPLDHLFTALDS